MKKELIVFVVVLLFLSLGMHYQEWLSHPITHFVSLSTSGAYGLGLVHPIVFTVFVYIILLIPRYITKFFRNKKRG